MLLVDPNASRLAVHTRAVGVLARLAHDLEIEALSLSGHATLEGDGFSGELVVPVASLRVAGVLHGERVDTTALRASDRAEIEGKLRSEVLAGTTEVRAEVHGLSRHLADVTVKLASGTAKLSLALHVKEQEGVFSVSGQVALSMRQLGIAPVRGPLGAFRVDDAVRVIFSLTLRPELPPLAA